MWWILWLILAVVLLLVELMAVELVSVWFSAAALVVSIISASVPQLHLGWQILIFSILSTILLILTRPFARKFLKRRNGQETNLETILNHTGIVEEKINNDLTEGTVKINGLIWSARSEDDSIIEKGELVVIQQIIGNKLIVKRKNNQEDK